MTTQPLLALLQLSDSAFPSGAFAHSYGIEQLINQRILRGTTGLEAFVTSYLSNVVATSDARATHAAAAAPGLDTVLRLDHALYRTRAASELRNACVQTGRRLTAEAGIHVETPLLQDYASALHEDATLGCHPVAFGVVSAALDVPPADAAAALMLSAANAMLQAAMRLGRISHRDAQATLHRLRPRIDALVQQIEAFDSDTPLLAFQPLQEIASMRHERAEARLFAS
jgi:urease accessory protein